MTTWNKDTVITLSGYYVFHLTTIVLFGIFVACFFVRFFLVCFCVFAFTFSSMLYHIMLMLMSAYGTFPLFSLVLLLSFVFLRFCRLAYVPVRLRLVCLLFYHVACRFLLNSFGFAVAYAYLLFPSFSLSFSYSSFNIARSVSFSSASLQPPFCWLHLLHRYLCRGGMAFCFINFWCRNESRFFQPSGRVVSFSFLQ